MSHSPVSGDHRPRTALLQQWVGMGDLVWHVPYFRKIAATSSDGQVSLIAPPSTFARELLGHEPWVREIIDFDRHPRRGEQRKGRHRGVLGLLRMGKELKPQGFERIVLFTNHTNRALVALRAGIPERLGYGTSWLQRRMLTKSAWIKAYPGPAVKAWKDVTAFAIAQGWADGPITPRLVVRPDALARMQARLADMPRPLFAFAIGSSEPYKQWGEDNFVALANLVAAMSLVQGCVGNDTGAIQIAAAVNTPSFVLLGPRPPLEHDPETLKLLQAPQLADIRPADVAQRLLSPHA